MSTDSPAATEGFSLYAVGARLLEARRVLLVWMLIGIAVGVASAFLTRSTYTSRATIVAVSSGGGDARVRGLASQLGIAELASLGAAAQGSSPQFLVQLAGSPVVLERIVQDSVALDDSTATVRVTDLLLPPRDGGGEANAEALRVRRAALALHRLITVWQVRETGSVRVEVRTEWAAVSHHVATALIQAVNDVNIEIGRGQAKQERRFVEARLLERGAELRAAEASQARFLSENREFRNSAGLNFEHDRLQRVVIMQQQLYSTLAQSVEDARIREIRDVAVVSLVEPPVMPLERDSRVLVLRALIGIIVGLLIGVILSLVARGPDASSAVTDPAEARFRMAVNSTFGGR